MTELIKPSDINVLPWPNTLPKVTDAVSEVRPQPPCEIYEGLDFYELNIQRRLIGVRHYDWRSFVRVA